jgi:beta-lactamase regulating signal transducer with metallopeptidase domain
MITIEFLAQWAVRSSLSIGVGALLMWAFRVKDPAMRLAAWTALMIGSLAIPLFSASAPAIPMPPVTRLRIETPAVERREGAESFAVSQPQPRDFDVPQAALGIYIAVSATLLLRLAMGLALSRRLLRRSRATNLDAGGIEVRESDEVASPLALGIVRPAILLPTGWADWSEVKRDAVLAHERSHIRRGDPALQLLSAVHRAICWHSPLSWVLHRQIVRTAEEASDDAAVAAVRDRASYAGILLDFMRSGSGTPRLAGVAMARHVRPEARINRILDSAALSRGITRGAAAAILVFGVGLAYVAAAVNPQEPPIPPAPPTSPAAPQAPVPANLPSAPAPPAPPAPPAARNAGEFERYIVMLGNDTISGSWNSYDNTKPEDLRAKYGSRFAWFRSRGRDYVITDSATLAEIEKAMEPQKEVNRQQSAVNAEQSRVNAMQSVVNGKQGDVNALQGEANRRQEIVNELQSSVQNGDKQAAIQKLQKAIDDLRASKDDVSQDAVNKRQSDVNREQSRVNAEQSKVNEMQSKVNRQQSLVSDEYQRRIRAIFESAVSRGVAKQLH